MKNLNVPTVDDPEIAMEIVRLQDSINFTNQTIQEQKEVMFDMKKAHSQRMQDLINEARKRKMKESKGENMLIGLVESSILYTRTIKRHFHKIPHVYAT